LNDYRYEKQYSAEIGGDKIIQTTHSLDLFEHHQIDLGGFRHEPAASAAVYLMGKNLHKFISIGVLSGDD
jgi:hypothetical protein